MNTPLTPGRGGFTLAMWRGGPQLLVLFLLSSFHSLSFLFDPLIGELRALLADRMLRLADLRMLAPDAETPALTLGIGDVCSPITGPTSRRRRVFI